MCSSDLRPQERQIQIQAGSGSGGNGGGSGGGKQARALRAMQSPKQTPTAADRGERGEEIEGDNPGLRYLEAQRQELQRQQMLELQRFKAKKAEIIKLNNRKKEIELMRSIEAEKNKLRKMSIVL